MKRTKLSESYKNYKSNTSLLYSPPERIKKNLSQIKELSIEEIEKSKEKIQELNSSPQKSAP